MRLAADLAILVAVIVLRARGHGYVEIVAMLMFAVALGAVGALTAYAWRRS